MAAWARFQAGCAARSLPRPAAVRSSSAERPSLAARASIQPSSVMRFRLRETVEGNTNAQLLLASLHYEGIGTRQDYTEAAESYRLAADRGVAPAQFRLASMYLRGLGVPRDDVQAAQLLQLAAEQGCAPARFNLALLHARGNGVPENDEQAANWLRLAADQGHAQALSRVDRMSAQDRALVIWQEEQR